MGLLAMMVTVIHRLVLDFPTVCVADIAVV